MPLITSEPIKGLDKPQYRKVRAKLAGWIFDYEWVGYQEVRDQLFFYRIPTLGECSRFQIASTHCPEAAYEFLDRIKLSEMPKYMKSGQVPKLVQEIIKEAFPTNDQQQNVMVDIMNEDKAIGSLLVRALESHIKAVDPDADIWSMTYQELIEQLAMVQVISGEKIVKPRKHKRRRSKQSREIPNRPREHQRPGRRGQERPEVSQRH